MQSPGSCALCNGTNHVVILIESRTSVKAGRFNIQYPVFTMTAPPHATQLVLSERPVGPITSTTFAVKSVPIPHDLAPGDVLVRVDWLSLDPAMRGWLRDTRSYLPPVQIGEKMRAQGLGTVIKGGGSNVRVGDTVRALVGVYLVGWWHNPLRFIYGNRVV